MEEERRSSEGQRWKKVDATRTSKPVNGDEERTKRRRKRIQATARKRTGQRGGDGDEDGGREGGALYTQLHSSLSIHVHARASSVHLHRVPVTHRTPRAVLNIKPINRRGGAVTDGRGHLATPPIDAGVGASSCLVRSGAAVARRGRRKLRRQRRRCHALSETRGAHRVQMRSGF